MNETRPDRTLAQLQDAVHAWISQWDDGYWSPLANLARLTEEVGELARGINHHHGDKPPKPGEEMGSVSEELADVLFVVITLANSLDIDLTEAFSQVMQKYDIRDAASGRFTRKG